MEAIEGVLEAPRKPVFRDIRRYYCQYCGLCRSKKSLVASHILSNHQDEANGGVDDKAEERMKGDAGKCSNTCGECSASFRKPAHLKQHMLTHSGEDCCSEVYKNAQYMHIFIKV